MDQVGVENPVPTEDEDEDDESENAEENAGKKPFIHFIYFLSTELKGRSVGFSGS